ncbi:MAG: ATP-dependent helicase HrpB [Myxococcales bacterium]
MATPIQPGVNQAVQQVAQQTQKPDAAPKNGASKFDQTMASKAEQAGQANQAANVQASQAAQATQKTTHVQGVQKAGKVDELKQANAVKKNEPVQNKAEAQKTRDGKGGMNGVEQLLTQMETRHASMDKFMQDALNGKMKLNQQQLLGLQAKVSEYSLELDLTGKVVEKATTGLKDTLRTQV